MDRRTLIKTAGLAALGLGFGGCATRRPAPAARPRFAINLPPVDAAWDRVIRTTVGLRPHRPSGFVLKADKLDAKTLIHNYGHGGAGISLSWGCGQVAAELALQGSERRAAVIGCGAVGLAAARQLQRRGFEVTIYAASVPPDTTSNMALAGFTPSSGVVAFDRRTPEWDAQIRHVAGISYRQLQLLVGTDYGVSWLYNYSPTDDARVASGRDALLPDLDTERVVLQPGEHPFPTTYAIRSVGMRIEPSIYLEALLRDFTLFGGHIVIRKFDTPRDLMTLSEPIVVNCTALGSRELFGDQELIPHKGQLTALVPQPEITYQTNGGAGRSSRSGPGGFLHMMPRRDGIILGGTREAGVWTLEPNQDERKRVVDGHIELFHAMAGVRDQGSGLSQGQGIRSQGIRSLNDEADHGCHRRSRLCRGPSAARAVGEAASVRSG